VGYAAQVWVMRRQWSQVQRSTEHGWTKTTNVSNFWETFSPAATWASLWWKSLLPAAWQHVRGRASEWKQKGKTELTWWLWVRLGHFAL
jgi:hypothetical protein